MAIDDTKLSYSSEWDIDQQVSVTEVSVSSGTTAIATIDDAADPPMFEVEFKPNSASYYFRMGTNSSDDTVAGLFSAMAYISGTSVYIKTTVAGTARLYIWEDGIVQ